MKNVIFSNPEHFFFFYISNLLFLHFLFILLDHLFPVKTTIVILIFIFLSSEFSFYYHYSEITVEKNIFK